MYENIQEEVKATPELVCVNLNVYEPHQVLSVGVSASQISFRNPLRTCTARIRRDQ